MPSAKEYNMMFKLNAKLGSTFGSTFSGAQKSLSETQKKIAELNKVQSDIAAYHKQQQAVEATSKKLETYRAQLDNVQREMSESGQYSSALANKELDLKQKIHDTESALRDKKNALSETESKLQSAGVDTANLSEESKKLTTQLDALSKEQAEAAEGAKQFGVQGADAFEAVGSAMIAAGIAAGLSKIYDEYKQCISIAAEFEETMSTVEALSGASEAEMTALSSYAKELGATTKFTAKESAEAMTYMGMAGWDAEQMMSGMSGMLNLAAASGEDLAATADIVTDNLTAFGLKASDTARFSDVLAAAATNSNTSVGVMGETFKNCAALAGALGYSIEDVAVAVGLMANAGIKGSNAGTALKNVFNGLLSGVTLTSEAFGEVEYSAIKADGTMKSFGETLTDLRGYFDQMTGAEKLQNAEAIAGQRAMAGFVSIMNSTDADFQSLTDSINNSAGAAQKMADIKLDNLNGQVTLLNSAADALKTTIGEAYSDEFKSLAKVGAEILTKINEFLQEHPVLLKSLIAITTEVGLILAAYYGYITAKKIMNTVRSLSAVLTAKEAEAATADAAAKGAETVATEAATVAQEGLNVAMESNPIGLVLGVVAALTVGLVALTEVYKKVQTEEDKLTLKAKQQKKQLDELNEEYKKTVELYGETSYEAQKLKWEIDDLSDAYESSAKTVKEYDEQRQALLDTWAQEQEANEQRRKEIEDEYNSTDSLISKLAELESAYGGLGSNSIAAINIANALNNNDSSLGLVYDPKTGSFNKSVDELREYADQKRQAEEAVAATDAYIDAINNLKPLEAQYLSDKAEYDLAEEAERAAYKKYDDWVDSLGYYIEIAMQSFQSSDGSVSVDTTPSNTEMYLDAWSEAKAYRDSTKEKYDASKAAYDEAAGIVSGYEEKYGFQTVPESTVNAQKLAEATKAVTSGMMSADVASKKYGVDLQTLNYQVTAEQSAAELLSGTLEYVESGFLSAAEAADLIGVSIEEIETGVVADKIMKIKEAYDEALEAAKSSIEGQYQLWDTAAIVVPNDIDTVNNSLETQKAYWTDYNTDLTALLGKTGDIEGLQEMIASFADGSSESVNMIAGMANATDDQLAEMVKNWQELQAIQDEAAGSLAEVKTDMTKELEEAQKEYEAAIDELDLSDSAATAAKDTVAAYAQAIRDGTDDAVLAANELVSKVKESMKLMPIFWDGVPDFAYGGNLDIGSTSGYPSIPHHASGTLNAASGYALVGEDGPELVRMAGGEQVYTAAETKSILSGGGGQTITIAPQFVVQGSMDESLAEEYAEKVAEMVRDKLDEDEVDARRGVYV